MKILCVSDQIDPIVYSTAVKERFGDVDFVLSAGDLPMEYLSFIVSCLNKPLFFVFGNHNLDSLFLYRPKYAERFASMPAHTGEVPEASCGATYIGCKSLRENGLLVAGFGGSMRYNGGPNQFSNVEMLLRMVLLIPKLLFNRLRYGRWLDILLTHAPPRGIHDRDDPCHRGFPAFNWFMKVFRPRYLVHGHIHLYDLNDVRVSTFEGTTVVNAFSHYVLEIRRDIGQRVAF
ncbi:MAG: metallophosphoesterase [Spirochaetes bacterium]|nr:metallophosphoesterase [Spirochaetota bacterium]